MSDYLARLFSLAGRPALVTGGTRGIGAAIAQALAGAGAVVTAVGRTAPEGPLEGVIYECCDVRDHESFAAICARVFQGTGGLPMLVNAAGITQPAAAGEARLRVFDETVEVNLRSVFRCCEAAIPHMKRAGGGSIINVTSIGASLGFPGNPAYVAAKGGVGALTRALALDLAGDGIRVNNLVPGYIRTAMTEASHADPAKSAERVSRMMIARWGEPSDLAGAAVFLASGASGYVTGADLVVDGGWTAKGL